MQPELYQTGQKAEQDGDEKTRDQGLQELG